MVSAMEIIGKLGLTEPTATLEKLMHPHFYLTIYQIMTSFCIPHLALNLSELWIVE